MNSIILSLLKESGLSYFIKGKCVIFACPECGSELQMEVDETVWECQQCKKRGNVITLHKAILSAQKKHLAYNPKDEYAEVKKLLKKVNDKKLKDELYGRITNLYKYFTKGCDT